MDARLVKFVIVLTTMVMVEFGGCFAATSTKIAVAPPPSSQEKQEKLLADLFYKRELMANQKRELDLEISARVARRMELEDIGSADKDVRVSVQPEISRIQAEVQKRELEKKNLERSLEDLDKSIQKLVSNVPPKPTATTPSPAPAKPKPIATTPSPAPAKPKPTSVAPSTISTTSTTQKPDAITQNMASMTDIDRIIAEHMIPRACDGKLWEQQLDKATLDKSVVTYNIIYKDIVKGPKTFAGGKARVIQLGALGQKRDIHDDNNYCGYYAVYNAVCLAQGPESLQERLLDRELFSGIFLSMLDLIKKQRKHGPYDNLAEDEIEFLWQQQKISEPYAFIVLPALGKNCEFTDLAKGVQQSGHLSDSMRYGQGFRAGRLPAIQVFFNVGGSHAHWVAIHVHRIADGVIEFVVVDSLNSLQWTDDDIIRDRLMPLYNFLTSSVSKTSVK